MEADQADSPGDSSPDPELSRFTMNSGWLATRHRLTPMPASILQPAALVLTSRRARPSGRPSLPQLNQRLVGQLHTARKAGQASSLPDARQRHGLAAAVHNCVRLQSASKGSIAV